MGGGKITPVESGDSNFSGDAEIGPSESGFLLPAYSGNDPEAPRPQLHEPGAAEAAEQGNETQLDQKDGAELEEERSDAHRSNVLGGQMSGDVTISIVKKIPGEGGKGDEGVDGEKDDDDDQDQDGQDLGVQPSGESVFDMLGVDNDGKLLPSWKQKTLEFVDGVTVSIVMTLLTILVLFLDDMRLACLPHTADDAIVYVTIVCLIFFAIELVLNSLAKPEYFLGFYFWLDLIATLSLLGDIPDFIEAVTGQQEGTGGVDDSTTLARAGRTSRAGTRAGRIARVMRLIRLVRLVKLYRHFESNKDQKNETDMKLDDDEEEVEQSRVGQKLSDLTTRRVIIGVLGMLFILPFFEIDAGIYGENSSIDTGGLEMIHEVALASGVDSTAFDKSFGVFRDQIAYALGSRKTSTILTLRVLNQSILEHPPVDRRTSEISVVRFATDGCDGGDFGTCHTTEAVYDVKWYSQMNAILNIGRTFFIILVLGVGALLFSKDANVLVLRPLERMIQKVKAISENPLARQAIIQDVDKEDAKLETRVLENSIMKICSLLAVGFGDAGAEVIAENMKKAGALNPMVPGRKMVAIFGFCDIRQFTDTTEVLQEEVMEFVNNIARIVHTEVALHGGAANKNIGDAFLLVWKFPRGTRWRDVRQCTISDGDIDLSLRKTTTDSEYQESHMSAQPLMPALSNAASITSSFTALTFARMSIEEKRAAIQNVADNALASFIIIHAALKRSIEIKRYSIRDDLNRRMPNFDVKMGFGLHVGWAIEGAIGSEYKVDASYLSPNVNMASRLEAATKQFGTSMLLSGDFVRCLSPEVRTHVRQIDCVTVKGSKQPMELYTYDISLDEVPEAIVPPGEPSSAVNEEYTTFSRVEYRNQWTDHPDLSVCWGLDYAFKEKFSRGYDAYTDGSWGEAKLLLEECRTLRRNKKGEVVVDGPSSTLLDFMGTTDFRPPQDWRGFRELTEK